MVRKRTEDEAPGERRLPTALEILVGVPVLAAVVLLLGWMIVPMFILPAMYVMGLGKVVAVVVGAFAGAAWMVAASTWTMPRNLAAILGAAVVGAAAFELTGLLKELLGAWSPAYGAIGAVSLLSSVLEQPSIQPRLMLGAGLAGALVGGLLGTRVPAEEPRAALWITTIAIHGGIALWSRSIWGGRGRR